MSYDLIIRSNESHSLFAPYAPLREFLLSLPHVAEKESGSFALDHLPRRWMDILPCITDAEGNDIDGGTDRTVAVNAIFLHISYGAKSNDPGGDYLPTAAAIARHLNWQIYDPQSDEVIPIKEITPPRAQW